MLMNQRNLNHSRVNITICHITESFDKIVRSLNYGLCMMGQLRQWEINFH